MSWRLVPTLLHEGCHAIMDDMFGELPFWMIEGSADWLGEAPLGCKRPMDCAMTSTPAGCA